MAERFRSFLRNHCRAALLTKEQMENDKKYNGHANHETWLVALSIDNDRGSYDFFRELAREVREAKGRKPSEYLSKREADANALAEALRDQFEEDSPVADHASVYADLMNAAFSEVDWHEIANSLLEEITEDK
jgi:hypothetical protein